MRRYWTAGALLAGLGLVVPARDPAGIVTYAVFAVAVLADAYMRGR